jgi:hypothetical protein
LVRYPAGHVFPPHWHGANERIVLIEGRVSIEKGEANRFIEPGGYAYLPARQIQKMIFLSQTLFGLRDLGRPCGFSSSGKVNGAVVSPNFWG